MASSEKNFTKELSNNRENQDFNIEFAFDDKRKGFSRDYGRNTNE